MKILICLVSLLLVSCSEFTSSQNLEDVSITIEVNRKQSNIQINDEYKMTVFDPSNKVSELKDAVINVVSATNVSVGLSCNNAEKVCNATKTFSLPSVSTRYDVSLKIRSHGASFPMSVNGSVTMSSINLTCNGQVCDSHSQSDALTLALSEGSELYEQWQLNSDRVDSQGVLRLETHSGVNNVQRRYFSRYFNNVSELRLILTARKNGSTSTEEGSIFSKPPSISLIGFYIVSKNITVNN